MTQLNQNEKEPFEVTCSDSSIFTDLPLAQILIGWYVRSLVLRDLPTAVFTLHFCTWGLPSSLESCYKQSYITSLDINLHWMDSPTIGTCIQVF